MPLVSLAPLLADAQARGYAVGAFSTIDLDLAQIIIEAAQAEEAPVVVALTAARASTVDLHALAAAVRVRAARTAIQRRDRSADGPAASSNTMRQCAAASRTANGSRRPA